MMNAPLNRCAVKGCPYLLRPPATHCREHAADVVTTERLEIPGLMVD